MKIILYLLIKKHQDDQIKTIVNASNVASLTIKYQGSVQQQQTIRDVQQQIDYIKKKWNSVLFVKPQMHNGKVT